MTSVGYLTDAGIRRLKVRATRGHLWTQAADIKRDMA